MTAVKASYVTNVAVTPAEMVLGLINANNNLKLTKDQVKFRGPAVIKGAVAEPVDYNGKKVSVVRNTSVDVDVLTDEVVDDFVTFKYQRVDLAKLFSTANANFLETTVAVGDNGLPEDMKVFIAEVKRKYGIQLTIEDFTFVKGEGNSIKVTAKVENLAYTGEFVIKYMPILDKRVANTILNGFEVPAKK